MKIIVFLQRITKIIQILTFNVSRKLYNLRFPLENHEKHENHRIQRENNKNNETIKIALEKNENHENR